MNAAHLHLMINHVPVLGTVFGLLLLAVALGRKSEDLKRAALATFVIVAVAAVITYLTGEPAEAIVKKLPGLAEGQFERHEDLAGAAMGGSVGIGVAALVGLLWFQGARPIKPWFGGVLLLGALVVTGLMGYTAYLGGQIRHTEMQAVVAGP
jgi:uncharacterized membrane protein